MKRTALPNGWHVVDDRDSFEHRSAEPPVSFPFPGAMSNDVPGDVDDVLKVADDVCRRMEFLARELDCLGPSSGDDEGPRAA